MEFKNIKIDEKAELNEEQKAFLGTLDQAFSNVLDKTAKDNDENDKKFNAVHEQLKKMAESQNYEIMQKQLNAIFEKLESRAPAMNEKQISAKERELNNKWVRAFLRKDVKQMEKISAELKFDPFMHTGTDTTQDNYLEQGSYTIPELFQNEIFRYAEMFGVARRDMRYLPFSGAGNERRLMRENAAVVISWVDEAGLKPITNGKIGKVTQKLKKLAAIAVFTDEVLDDSAVNLVSYTAQVFAEKISEEEDRVFLTGATTAGDPFDGVINASDVVLYPLAATDVIADLTADDLNKAIYTVTAAKRAGASWYMSSEVFGHVQRLKDDYGQYIVQQPTGTAPASIWGYPVVISDVLPGLKDGESDWANSTPFMFFANLNKTCVYGDKGGVQMKMLEEATLTDGDGDTINLAQNDMTGVRIVKRVGYVPILPEGIVVFTTGAAT
jgi:HK97 family phage major capsid protein